MENMILLAILVAVLNNLAVQILVIPALLKGKPAAASGKTAEVLSPEEQEARRLAAEAQAKYEQGFVNLMSYDGMPAGRKGGF